MNSHLASQPADVEVDARALFRSLARALPYLIVFVGLLTAGAYYVLSHIGPRYLAQATILIETGESEFARGPNNPQSTTEILDQEAVASQVQLIQSRDLARTVAQKLHLAERAEFNPVLRRDSLVSDILAAVGLGKDPLKSSVEQQVIERFAKRLSVYAVERSRVIMIEFSSEDPQLAADAANTVAEEYIALQRATKRATTENAATWLESEIESLQPKVQEAEAKVEAYRANNDLFTSGGGQSPATLSQQQLADLNAELARVSAERADAEAKAAQIRAGLEGGTALNQLDVLNSPLIQRLIEQQVTLRARIAQLSATLLPGHPRMRELSAQLSDLDRQIQREAQKMLAGLEAETRLAEAREQEIQQSLSRLKAAAARANDAGVDLRALEREAAAQRDLLDSYLRRYREALARQEGGYLPADARIISRASVPVEPSFPKVIPMTAAVGATGLLLGVAAILIRELASGRPMRPVPAAPLPLVASARPVGGNTRWADDRGVRRMMPVEPELPQKAGERAEAALAAIAGQVIADGRKRIMVTMAEGTDVNGRPLAAVALARAIARSDRRPVLIDFRSDNANSISMGEGADLPGFSDLLAGDASFAQVIFRDRKSRVHFIPSGSRPLTAQELADQRVGILLSALDHTYDHVILDVADDVIEAVGPGCDAAVVVSEFDTTDARTERAFQRIAAVSKATVALLMVEPPGSVETADHETTAGEAA